MQDPIYSKIEGQPRPTLFAASGAVWVAAVGLWLAELILARLPASFSDAMALENAVYYLPFVVLPVALYMWRRPGLSEAMRLNPLPVLPVLSVSLLAVLSVYVASIVSVLWGMGLDALGLSSPGGFALPETRPALALMILTQAAMPAVCEELLFRGFVLSAWESRGTWFAVGVSAALFALLHANLYGLPAYLLVGILAGFVTFALDSLYAGMVYHTVYNTACLVISWKASGAAAETGSETVSAFGLALETLMILSMMAMLLVSLWLRARREGYAPIPRIRRPLAGRERGMLSILGLTLAASMAVILALSSL